MISLTNLKLGFGDFVLFDGIGFSINPKDRIALVGRNGAGKSTLLQIIAGERQPNSGRVVIPAGTRIGYLPQQMRHAADKTVIGEAMTVFSEITRIEGEIAAVNRQLARRDDYESSAYTLLIQHFNDLSDRLHLLNAVNPRGNAERTLSGLGFKARDFDRPCTEFSEGWNMRIELAKILLTKPDLLLLDEPTNHLDITSIQWLETYLETFAGALLIVSHDRSFIDHVTNRTIEIVLGRIYDYKVRYSQYRELRRERMAQQRAAWENQQQMIKKTREFIETFRYKPTKSRQVQSRIKMLEKLEPVCIDREDRSDWAIKFPPAERSARVVFSCTDLAVKYDGDPIFTHANLMIERGDRIAFVGRNGEGKSTMVKLITGSLPACAGSFHLGAHVSLGYYAQNQQEFLDDRDSVFETVDRVATGPIRTKLRDLLAAFLFRGSDIDKKVAVLSGGERSRLAMAKLMLQPYNFLVLDEPTNHMDIRSKEIIREALLAYTGTLLVVSHDRVFLDGLADKIYEFRDGRLYEYLGGIQDFLCRRKLENMEELRRDAAESATGEDNLHDREKTAARLSYQAKKAQERQQRKLQQAVENIESEIERHEREISLMDHQLARPEGKEFPLDFYESYDREKKALERAMQQWEAAHTAYDAFCMENNL